MVLTEKENIDILATFYKSVNSQIDQTENDDVCGTSCRFLTRDCHQVLSEIETELNHILGICIDDNECEIRESRGDLADLQQSLSRMHIRLQEIHEQIVYVHEQLS